MVMRADNRGEGGVLALHGAELRAAPRSSIRRRKFYIMLGMAGAALSMARDRLPTPAVSVLSAIEGLNVATPAFEPLIVPIALAVIVALFAVQHFGTGGVGCWFGSSGSWPCSSPTRALGLVEIVKAPRILLALAAARGDPVLLAPRSSLHGLGAVTLAVTAGAEALYADDGPLWAEPDPSGPLSASPPRCSSTTTARRAVRRHGPRNPFFRLGPEWVLDPLVVATVRGDLAGDDPAMAQQAAAGLSPRIKILHTSASEYGQTYVPAINWIRARRRGRVRCWPSVLDLAAYGIAVTGTMLATTLLVFVLALRAWKWGWPLSILVRGSFMIVDGTHWSANMVKFIQGGWVPLALATLIFAAMWTWYQAAWPSRSASREGSLPMETLLSINPRASIARRAPRSISPGTCQPAPAVRPRY